jgi:hypothetical protein
MADREGGQWNVATKEDAVYLERVSDSDERLFDDLLEPHEARQLARLLKKYADKLDDSDKDDKDDKEDKDDESDKSDKDDESDDDDSDDDESDDDDDSDDKKSSD